MLNILILLWIVGLSNSVYGNLTLNAPNICKTADRKMMSINKTVTTVHITAECCEGYMNNGTNCIPQCNPKCNFGICYEPNKCACNSGFSGPYCNTIDNSFCYKILDDKEKCTLDCQCRYGGKCFRSDGKCSCDTGWNGTICTNRICPENKYGRYCGNICRCNINETCNAVSGVCRGYPKVQDSVDYYQKCSTGIKCDKRNTECDVKSGKCICTPGWTGDNCSKKCPHLRYGRDCKLKCPDYSTNKTFVKLCDHKTGKIICNPGYTGEKCDKICHSNRYGDNCNKTCKCKSFMECSPTDGSCSCPAGFYGKDCKTECNDGNFGLNCSESCDCNRNANCRIYDGYCICKPGWIGENCDQRCPDGFFGLNCNHKCLCSNKDVCHYETGCLSKNSEGNFISENFLYAIIIGATILIILLLIVCVHKRYIQNSSNVISNTRDDFDMNNELEMRRRTIYKETIPRSNLYFTMETPDRNSHQYEEIRYEVINEQNRAYDHLNFAT